MKLVQKILSHGLLITFIVLAFFFYMNRVELFPQWFSKPAPTAVSRAPAVVDKPAAAVPDPEADRDAPLAPPVEVESVEVDQGIVAPEQVAPVSAGQSPVVEPDTSAETAIAEPAGNPEQGGAVTAAAPVAVSPAPDAAVADSRPSAETESPDAAVAAEAEAMQPVVANTAEEITASVDVQTQTAAETAPAVAEPPQPAGEPETADSDTVFQQQLELARAYFWKRDIQAALQAYRILSENWPEHAEVWGEMGNLYFSIRRKPEAVNAYAHAIELLTAQGDRAQARALLDVVYRLDARRAGQLEMSLRQAGG
ncbi:MAG TPA: hypothetical protein ENK49_06430 [Gammaproteobacteria bacterium]|nr:hypothetical protein [Gammaproteobacteria bacterium]